MAVEIWSKVRIGAGTCSCLDEVTDDIAQHHRLASAGSDASVSDPAAMPSYTNLPRGPESTIYEKDNGFDEFAVQRSSLSKGRSNQTTSCHSSICAPAVTAYQMHHFLTCSGPIIIKT
ncbi:hypothetical protein CISG_01298 [Coccidioides immitis RMSCC 3703]|nr:hypothetical protein CISG_01298 [Coccidioides immitis RMSCC 3703]